MVLIVTESKPISEERSESENAEEIPVSDEVARAGGAADEVVSKKGALPREMESGEFETNLSPVASGTGGDSGEETDIIPTAPPLPADGEVDNGDAAREGVHQSVGHQEIGVPPHHEANDGDRPAPAATPRSKMVQSGGSDWSSSNSTDSDSYSDLPTAEELEERMGDVPVRDLIDHFERGGIRRRTNYTAPAIRRSTSTPATTVSHSRPIPSPAVVQPIPAPPPGVVRGPLATTWALPWAQVDERPPPGNRPYYLVQTGGAMGVSVKISQSQLDVN